MSNLSLVVLSDHCHHALGEYFRSLDLFEKVDSYQPEFLDPATAASVKDGLGDYDVIFTSHDKGDDLSIEALKGKHGSSVIPFAPLVFYGLQPDVGYVISKGEFLYNPALAGDYHYSVILELMKRGLDVEDVIHLLVRTAPGETIDVQATWDSAVSGYQDAEKDFDVKIADFIAAESRKSQTFYNFNLPAGSVLGELGDRLVKHLGEKATPRLIPPAANDLVTRSYFPVPDYLAEALGFEYRTSQVVRGKVEGNSIDVSRETAMRMSAKFFAEFCRSKKCSIMDLQPLTPLKFAPAMA